MDGMAGVLGGTDLHRDRMRRSLEERTDRPLQTFETEEVVLYSTNPGMDQENLQICFNGYLHGREGGYAAYIADRFREDGISSIEALEGVFRLAIYDRREDALHVATDKLGMKRLLYTEEPFSFSHCFPPLFAVTGPVQIDQQAVRRFVISRHAYNCGGRRLAEGVTRMPPAYRMTVPLDGRKEERQYWQVHDLPKTSVSDDEAADRIEALLHEAIEGVIDTCDHPPNVFLSGGLDSSFLTALLVEHTDPVRTFVGGMREEHFEPARKVADYLGTDHHEMEVPLELPREAFFWHHDAPLVGWPIFYHPSCHTDIPGENQFHGELSDLLFPHRSRYPFLERLRPFSPVFKAINRAGIDKAVDRVCGTGFRQGVNTIVSDYGTRGLVEEDAIRGVDMEDFLPPDLEEGRPPEAVLRDYAHVSNEQSLSEIRHHLAFRAYKPFQLAVLTDPYDYRTVYGYSPAVEYVFSLPYKQVHGRRLMRKIGRDRLPDEILHRPASGATFWGHEMFKHQITESIDEYRKTVSSLMDRGLLDVRMVEKHTGLKKMKADPHVAWFMLRLYLLEKWFQAFVDRERPWLPVS